MTDKERMEKIMEDWDINEQTMGEQAALHVACEQNGVTHEWWIDHLHLLDDVGE